MNNFFVAQSFDWGWRQQGRALSFANRLLRAAGSSWSLSRSFTPFSHTTTLEQRINLWHLVSQPLAYGVRGDVVELGCFEGRTAVIFAQAIEQLAPGRQLHLFDHFGVGFHLGDQDIEQEVRRNFELAGCAPPFIHRGDFADTVPAALPERIAFAHFDCGFGGDVPAHRATLTRLLTHVYPRMSAGAIGVLMDSYDPEAGDVRNCNPGVAPTVTEFFADKPERIVSLWGGQYAHAFFRKA